MILVHRCIADLNLYPNPKKNPNIFFMDPDPDPDPIPNLNKDSNTDSKSSYAKNYRPSNLFKKGEKKKKMVIQLQ
jgi:hypothetical protein